MILSVLIVGNLINFSEEIFILEEEVFIVSDGFHSVLHFQLGFLQSRETGLVGSAMLAVCCGGLIRSFEMSQVCA